MKIEDIIKKPINFEVGLFLFTIFVYIIYSIVMISYRIPYFDEVNSWNITANCNFGELLEVCKHEGHFMLWYLIIKPFASNNIGFPQSLFAINWIFAFFSVLILWFKAPFNPWLKMFITFSLPIQMFSIYARCYAIGVMFLFLICSLYSTRKEHPILYSLLILLLANTSVMGCIAAFVFGILYVFELVQSKIKKEIDIKNLLIPVGIFALCAVLVLIQVANYSVPWYSTEKSYLYSRISEILGITDYLPKDIVIILQSLLLLSGLEFFIKDKKPYLFVILTTAIFFYIGLNIYTLGYWHYMFLFLFFVSAMWMYMDGNDIKSKFQKIYLILFFVLSFASIFFFKFPWYWNGFHLPTTYYIKENIEKFDGSKIFLYPTDSSVIGMVPELRNYNIDFYDAKGYSYKSADLYIHQWDAKRIDLAGIRHAILTGKRTNKIFVLLTHAEDLKYEDTEKFMNVLNHNNIDLNFRLYKQLKDVDIYRIIIKKNNKIKRK